MKKILIYLMSVFFASLIFMQCARSNEEVTVDDRILSTSKMDVYKINKNLDFYLSKIDSWNIKNDFQVNTRLATNNTIDDKVWEVIEFKDIPNTYAVLNKQEGISTAYYFNDGNVVSQYSIVVNTTESINEINYIDSVTGNSFILRLDEKGNLISDVSFRSSKGQATARCIADAYTNHGWSSVFAWVATAFVPEVAVGIAAGCIVKNI